MAINLSVFAVAHVNAKIWYNSDQMQLGLWLNDHDRDKFSRVLFDRDYIGKVTKTEQDEYLGDEHYTVAGFWMNDEIRFDDILNLDEYDYVVTKKNLNLKLLTQKGVWRLYSTK